MSTNLYILLETKTLKNHSKCCVLHKAQYCLPPAHPYALGRARIILSRKWKLLSRQIIP